MGTVSYSLSIVTIAVGLSVPVCEIFSVKEWCDLENRVRVRSRSLEMAPFDRSRTSSYSPSIVTIWRYIVSFASYNDLFVENREVFIPHLYLAPPQGVTPSKYGDARRNKKYNTRCFGKKQVASYSPKKITQ